MASMRTAAHWQVAFVCRVGINQPALERLVSEAEAEAARQQHTSQLASQLIGAGASLPIAQSLLGISKAEFSSLRQTLGLSAPPTRKRVSDDESRAIYRHWETLGKTVGSEAFLALHARSGQPIYVLWGLVQDWLHTQPSKGR
jgi:hypothetical protein